MGKYSVLTKMFGKARKYFYRDDMPDWVNKIREMAQPLPNHRENRDRKSLPGAPRNKSLRPKT